MATYFKTLTASDISITPFTAYPTLTAVSGSNDNGIELYVGHFDNNKYNLGDPNDPIVLTLPKTINGKYQYLVHDSLNHLFYRDYSIKDKVVTSNIDKKSLYDYVSCFSIPQEFYGLQIAPGTVEIDLTYSGSTHVLIDDSNGNLIDSTISSSFTNSLQSMTSGSVGKWIFSDGYVFGDKSISGNFIKDRSGNFDDANTSKVYFVTSDYGYEAYLSGSYIRIPHNELYNFRANDDFNLSMLIKIPVTSYYSSSLDEIIVTKNGRYLNQIAISGNSSLTPINTHLLNQPITTQYPFTISLIKSGSDYGKIKFDKYDGNIDSNVTSSLHLNDNKEHFIVCQKTGSYLELYIDGNLQHSVIDYSTLQTDNLCDIFLGCRGDYAYPFNGYIQQFEIKQNAIPSPVITEYSNRILSQSFDYYIGNVFYEYGLIPITSNNRFYRQFSGFQQSGSLSQNLILNGDGQNTTDWIVSTGSIPNNWSLYGNNVSGSIATINVPVGLFGETFTGFLVSGSNSYCGAEELSWHLETGKEYNLNFNYMSSEPLIISDGINTYGSFPAIPGFVYNANLNFTSLSSGSNLEFGSFGSSKISNFDFWIISEVNLYELTNAPDQNYSWSFDANGSNTIQEWEILCTVDPSDLNYSTNSSLFTNERGTINEYLPMVNNPNFTPYVTQVGLYNDNQELVALAKLSRPIPRLRKMSTTFIVRFDA